MKDHSVARKKNPPILSRLQNVFKKKKKKEEKEDTASSNTSTSPIEFSSDDSYHRRKVKKYVLPSTSDENSEKDQEKFKDMPDPPDQAYLTIEHHHDGPSRRTRSKAKTTNQEPIRQTGRSTGEIPKVRKQGIPTGKTRSEPKKKSVKQPRIKPFEELEKELKVCSGFLQK